MPVYIGKSGDLVGWHRCLTDWQTSEYRATQLVSSIKFKLSHANIHFWYFCRWIHGDFFRRSIVLAFAWNPWEAIARWWRRRGGGREMRGRGNLGNCWDEKWLNTKQWTQRSRILLSGTPYIWQESTKNEKLLQSSIFSVRYCQTVLYQGPWQWNHWNTDNEGQVYNLI